MTSIESTDTQDEHCEDCGAVVVEGKTGCQRIFEEVIAREFSDFRYGRVHRLTVDAYSLQHPDKYMRSGKSFAAHLTGICSALEFQDSLDINRRVQRWLSGNPAISKPARVPERRGDLTVLYVHGAADPEEHISRVREWARSVWDAWSDYDYLARQLIAEAIDGTEGQ